MEPRDFAHAIIDAWDDPMPMLVYADSLEERGEQARADLLRASATWFRSGGDGEDPASREDLGRLWRRARPAWWDPYRSRVACDVDRGLARPRADTPDATTRLGQLPWLARAVAEGWLASIRVRVRDRATAEALAGPGLIGSLPLSALITMPEPSVVERVLDRANLVEFVLELHRLTIDRARRLADHPELRSIHLGGLIMPPEDRRAALATIARMDGLRELQTGIGPMTDGDLAAIAGMSHLGCLRIANALELTDRGLDHLHAMVGLRHLELLYIGEGVTDAGLDRLRAALPNALIHVEVDEIPF